MFLLDTNVISELRKPKPHPAVAAWISSVNETELFISALTLGEIQAGIEITRGQDPARAAELKAWLDQIAATQTILPLDGRICRQWAKLMRGKSDHLLEDALIAATAVVHRLTVVTTNIRDFQPFDVPLLNPFTPA